MNLHLSHEHTPSTRALRVHGISIHGDAVGRLAETRFFVACAASFQQPAERIVMTRPTDGRGSSSSNSGAIVHADSDAASVVTAVDVVTIRRLHFRHLRPTIDTRRMLVDLVGLWRRQGKGGRKETKPPGVTASGNDNASSTVRGGGVMDLQFYDCVLDERWQRDLLQSVLIGGPQPATSVCRPSRPLRTLFYQGSGVTSAAEATVNGNNNNRQTSIPMSDERIEALFRFSPPPAPTQVSPRPTPQPTLFLPLPSKQLLPEAAGLSLFAYVTTLDLSYQVELQSVSFLFYKNDQTQTDAMDGRRRIPTMPHLERLWMRTCISLNNLDGIECVAATLVELCISDSNVDTLAPLRPCSALEELWIDGCTSITTVDDYFIPDVASAHSNKLVSPQRLKTFYICGSGLPDHVAENL